MISRLETILSETREKCVKVKTLEFEFYIENWGVMWYPWFIDINEESQDFEFNDLSQEDLNHLVHTKNIELIKTYDNDELNDEIVRKRYRLIIPND